MRRIIGGAVIGGVAGACVGRMRATAGGGSRPSILVPTIGGLAVGALAGTGLHLRRRSHPDLRGAAGGAALRAVGIARPLVERVATRVVDQVVDKAVEVVFDRVTAALVAAKAGPELRQ